MATNTTVLLRALYPSEAEWYQAIGRAIVGRGAEEIFYVSTAPDRVILYDEAPKPIRKPVKNAGKTRNRGWGDRPTQGVD